MRAGVDTRKVSPARKCRAMGRIEQPLLDGDVAPTDLRPSLANRTITPSPLNVVNVHRNVFKACPLVQAAMCLDKSLEGHGRVSDGVPVLYEGQRRLALSHRSGAMRNLREILFHALG